MLSHIYRNQLLILNIYISDSYARIPYVLNLNTNLVFSENDFQLLCKKLEKRSFKNMSHVLEYARQIVTEKNKSIKKREFFEIVLDDTVLTQKSYSFWKMSRKMKTSYIKETDIPGPKYTQAVISIKWEYTVLDVKVNTTEYKTEDEINLIDSMRVLQKRKFLTVKKFTEALYKKINFSSRKIEVDIDNKYREKHTYIFSLQNKKVLREKIFYDINRGNYHLQLLYIVWKRPIPMFSLNRTSKNSIVELVKKVVPLAYEIRISGWIYPIRIETIKIKNKKLLKQT